jgi:L-lactate dehydrogenase complex protein LldF
MWAGSWLFRSPGLYVLAGKMARWFVPRLPRFLLYNRFNAWGQERELPLMPRNSFRELYQQRNDAPSKSAAARRDGSPSRGK